METDKFKSITLTPIQPVSKFDQLFLQNIVEIQIFLSTKATPVRGARSL